jgi:hypothetical protein
MNLILDKNDRGTNTIVRETAKNNSAFLLFVVACILIATSSRSLIAVPGLFLPVIFFKREDILYVIPLMVVLLIKIVLGMVVYPSDDYAAYSIDNVWIIREAVTVFLFFAWMIIGYRKIDLDFMKRQNGIVIWLIILMIYVSLYVSDGSFIISGISNSQALLWFMFFIIFTGKYSIFSKTLAFIIILSTGLIPRQSSFTVISSVAMMSLLVLSFTPFAKTIVRWRAIAIVAIVFLVTASSFAYLVHVRATRDTGEGNNGYTRSILANAGYNQFINEPLLGSPYGRGILPLPVIQKLGWEQYFLDPSTYNIYSLSFHNSFIYLLTRYGLLSLVPFWLIVRRIPRSGILPMVIFTLVLFLSAGANVVIESLKSGPGVALALGALFSVGRNNQLPPTADRKGGKSMKFFQAAAIPTRNR